MPLVAGLLDEIRGRREQARRRSAMSTKITKGLTAIALAGVLGGGLAACGSSASPASAPKPPASPTASAPAQADPSRDMAAWLAAGGADALNSVGRCMSGLGDRPTRQQIAALNAALAKAQSRPMPSSVDPKGAYPALLEQYKKVVTAFESGDVAAATSAASAIANDAKTLQGEMRAAGVEVSP
jgi:hypothetical protein